MCHVYGIVVRDAIRFRGLVQPRFVFACAGEAVTCACHTCSHVRVGEVKHGTHGLRMRINMRMHMHMCICVWMCMWMCMCTCVCEHSFLRTCMQDTVCGCSHVRMHEAYIHDVCMHDLCMRFFFPWNKEKFFVRAQSYIYICIYIYIYICMNKYMHVTHG